MYNFSKAIGDFCQGQRQLLRPRAAIAQRLGSIALLAAVSAATSSVLGLKAVNAQSSLADGTYLYGQSPEAETIGSEYLVFEIRNGNVAGAFYMPSSEFACFTGNVDSRQLSLSVIAPYENEAYDYAIALEARGPVADNSGTPVALGLEGYHHLDAPSENDLRILNVCRAQ